MMFVLLFGCRRRWRARAWRCARTRDTSRFELFLTRLKLHPTRFQLKSTRLELLFLFIRLGRFARALLRHSFVACVFRLSRR